MEGIIEHPDGYDPHEDDDMDIFLEVFDFALQQMATVYKMHRQQKGDSWEDMTSLELLGLFFDEMDEWETAKGSLEEIHELTDVLNVGLMLLTKLSQEDNHGQTMDSGTHNQT